MVYDNKYKKDTIPVSDISAFDRLPPQNLEAEQALLGSLMLDKDAIIKIENAVTGRFLQKLPLQNIYRYG